MAKLWIDVYAVNGGPDVPGSKVGGGPITTATEWVSVANLDAVGTFRFIMPASDPKAAYIQSRRVVWCLTVIENAIVFVGAGTITRVQISTGDVPLMVVSGDDLLAELADRTVGQLNIMEQDWTYLTDIGAVRYIGPVIGDVAQTNAYDGNVATATSSITISDYGETDAEALYIGYDALFDGIRFDIDTANTTQTATLLVQYYSEPDGWKTVEDMVDGTSVTGKPFAQTTVADAVITFTRPTDWARSTPTEAAGSWFWVRISRVTAVGGNIAFTLNEVSVYADVPTLDGVNLIMAKAPEPWAGTYPDTTTAQYIAFDGESVLTALLTLVERGGTEPE